MKICNEARCAALQNKLPPVISEAMSEAFAQCRADPSESTPIQARTTPRPKDAVSSPLSHGARAPTQGRNGMLFGLLGTLCFSLTLPATRVAVASIDPLIVGMGRIAIASFFAGMLLWLTRQPPPSRLQLKRLLIVSFGAVIGFSNLSAWAMQRVEASHGAVVLGLLPLGTAMVGSLRFHERPSLAFWAASLVGSITVVCFSLSSGYGKLQPADLALFGAVILCSFGYAEGACLAREMGGWQVISWALVISLPMIAMPLFLVVKNQGLDATPASWLGLAYLSCFSSFLGFFAWYRGLAEGGIARVSQSQLLQPFLTLSFASLFLAEKISGMAMISAGVVAASIFVSFKSRVQSIRS